MGRHLDEWGWLDLRANRGTEQAQLVCFIRPVTAPIAQPTLPRMMPSDIWTVAASERLLSFTHTSRMVFRILNGRAHPCNHV